MTNATIRAQALDWPRRLTALAALTLVLAGPSSAYAHHGMHGRLPATFYEGLISGLAHPVIGLDHLLAVVALGLVAALLTNGWVLPTAFVVATIAGTVIHLLRVGLPATELVIPLGIVLFGCVPVFWRSMTSSRALVLLALATFVTGIAHGYALGESIVGAEPTPLGAYLLGFVAIQLGIATGVRLAVKRLLQRPEQRGIKIALQVAGTALVTFGIAWVTWS